MSCFLKLFKLPLYRKIVVNTIFVHVLICAVDETHVVEPVHTVTALTVENKLHNYISFRIQF